MKIEIELGNVVLKGAGGEPAIMDIDELLATRLLVQGNSGSGKSHLIRRILEQSAGKVQQIIIDPEGDFVSLSDKFGHVVADARRSDVELETIALRIRQARVSAVLNLEHLEVDGQMRAAGIFLNALFDADREFWHPALVVVDEAQLFAPTEKGEFSEEARRISLSAMTNLMCRGRKRGLAGIIATQRLAKVAKNVAAEASNFLMGRTWADSGAAQRERGFRASDRPPPLLPDSFPFRPVPPDRLPGNEFGPSFRAIILKEHESRLRRAPQNGGVPFVLAIRSFEFPERPDGDDATKDCGPRSDEDRGRKSGPIAAVLRGAATRGSGPRPGELYGSVMQRAARAILDAELGLPHDDPAWRRQPHAASPLALALLHAHRSWKHKRHPRPRSIP